MAEASGRQLGTVGALCLSVISSVAIVICNKALISNLGFSFGAVLLTLSVLPLIFLSLTFQSLGALQFSESPPANFLFVT
jgi:solute carrier family 35 protein E3